MAEPVLFLEPVFDTRLSEQEIHREKLESLTHKQFDLYRTAVITAYNQKRPNADWKLEQVKEEEQWRNKELRKSARMKK